MGKDWLHRIVAGLEDKPVLGVYITINGVTIYARTAVNRGPSGKKTSRGIEPHRYECDDGSFILHIQEDGAVALAKMLLDTIKEQRAAPAKERAP